MGAVKRCHGVDVAVALVRASAARRCWRWYDLVLDVGQRTWDMLTTVAGPGDSGELIIRLRPDEDAPRSSGGTKGRPWRLAGGALGLAHAHALSGTPQR